MAQTTHLPIGIGLCQFIEDLPQDMLLEIFSYLRFEDLVKSVQYVSSQWHSVSQDNHLWRKLQYAPHLETDEEVIDLLKQCPKLQTFNLQYRDVGSGLLKLILKNCSELRNLILCKCQLNLSEQYVESLVFNCQNLEHIKINYKIISVLGVAQMIKQLQKLKTLDVVGDIDCQRSMWLRSIGEGCPLLQHVDIMLYKFRSVDFKYFMQMKEQHLKSIKISCTNVDGRCTIPELTGCKTLKKVEINHPCQFVSTGGSDALRCMENITALTFTNTDYSVVGNLVGLFTNNGMRHLKELSFHSYFGYKDELCETICNNCPQLIDLFFYDCFDLTDRSLEQLPKLKDLENLELSGQFTSLSLNFVFKCKHLKCLKLNNCAELTEQCMKQLICLNLLEYLLLDSCYIKGLPLNLIPSSLTKLKYLIVLNSEEDNSEVLHQLRAEMPHLTILEFPISQTKRNL